MSRFVYGNDDNVYIDHDGIKFETKKGVDDEGAILFSIKGQDVWIPKKLIEDYNDDLVAVKRWWADKNGFKGDW